MAREILILWAGRHQRDAWESLCAGYRRRLRRHLAVRERPLKVKAAGDGKERRLAEGRALLAALPEPSWPIALDRRGEMLGSEAFAAELGRLRERWPHPIAFLLGSDLGLDPEVLSRSRRRLSFGPLTLPHELARVILYEQLYRALTLERGIKYHRRPL